MEKEKNVTVTLFRDSEKYRDDVTVIINGKTYQIKRGIPVSVPISVAKVLRDQARQQREASSFIEQNVKQ